MVSTRQSSNVGGGGENTGVVSEAGPSKTLRHNNAPAPSLPESSTSAHIAEVSPAQAINLMNLPPEIMLKILGCLSYRTVAHLRPVRFWFLLSLFCFLLYAVQLPVTVTVFMCFILV
jgi:hypothetical protein